MLMSHEIRATCVNARPHRLEPEAGGAIEAVVRTKPCEAEMPVNVPSFWPPYCDLRKPQYGLGD